MPRTWLPHEVEAFVAARPQWFPAEPRKVRRLGSGESYDAWLVLGPSAPADVLGPSAPADGADAVVLRLARHPRAQLPADPRDEYAALHLAPPGIAARAIGLDQIADCPPGQAGPAAQQYPAMALGFVPGRVLAAADWSAGMHGHLAGVFARLHARGFDHTGGVREVLEGSPGRAAGSRGPGLDFAAEVEGVIEHWSGRLDASDRESWAALHEPMRAYAVALAPAFADLRRFALIHGDPCLTNLVVDRDRPALIDWEWARIGDPARDLAFLGGAVHAAPWYAPLTDAQITAFVRAYLDAGGHGDLGSLRMRRDAWLAAEAFGVIAYLQWTRAERPRASAAGWRDAAIADLLRSLAEFLRPWGA